MTEESSTSTTPTPAGNQNLIIGLVLGAAVLLLFLLVLQMTGGGLSGSSKSSKIDDLKKQLEEKRAVVNSERARLGLDPLSATASGQSAEAIATRITSDSSALAGLVRQMQTILTQREEELSGTKAIYNAASRQVTSLSQQLEQARLGAAEADPLRAQLADARTLLDGANRRAESLQAQLATAPNETTMASLRTNLDEALKQRDSYQGQLRDAEARLKGMVGSEQLTAVTNELAEAKSRLAKVEPENNKLRYEIQKIRAELDRTRLFVEKVEDLPAAAKELYIELTKLESAKPAELRKEYTRINEALKAKVVDTISFPTGSSRIDLDKAEEIRRATQSGDDGSFFLVVGYASTSGNLESNRKLSADRATTIASIANTQKKENQGLQAVFLAGTSRFSATELPKNQVCEIWEIRK